LRDEAFAGPVERWENQERLDEIIERWTRTRGPYEVTETLQRVGVAALPVYTGARIARDPHVCERNLLQPVEHPVIGTKMVVDAPWRFSDDGVGVRHASPCIGEHNRYVLGEILGMSDEEIERLTEDGVLD
jgi:crotonobetainyl-CoA:carnitine CoA-transferase CaiB-like acyl-CoA transferase